MTVNDDERELKKPGWDDFARKYDVSFQPLTSRAFDAGWDAHAALAVPTGKGEMPSPPPSWADEWGEDDDYAAPGATAEAILANVKNLAEHPGYPGFVKLSDLEEALGAPAAPVAVQGVTADREAIIREVIDWIAQFHQDNDAAPVVGVAEARKYFGVATSVPKEPIDPREVAHIECDCVPDLGPSHCHLCGERAGHPMPWDEAHPKAPTSTQAEQREKEARPSPFNIKEEAP